MMEPTTGDFWMNTINAQGYSGLGSINFSQYFFALLFIVILLLGLAYLANKAGWLKTTRTTSSAPVEKNSVIFYSQYTANQSFMLVAQEEKLYCYIYHGKTLMLATPLPDVIIQSNERLAVAEQPSPNKVSFAQVWQQVLGRKRVNKG